jgi:hypothetical protein
VQGERKAKKMKTYARVVEAKDLHEVGDHPSEEELAREVEVREVGRLKAINVEQERKAGQYALLCITAVSLSGRAN